MMDIVDSYGVIATIPDSREEAEALESGARSHQAHTFLNEDEKAKLLRLARKAGLSQSAYLRMLVNQQPEDLAAAV